MDFGPREVVFQKPKESNNHLNALYMRDHINERPISRMLVDGGAIVNLMPYSLYKKFGGTDEELIKMNMTVSGVGGGDPIGAKGVASMELTVGSKTLATAFFISEVQGNFSLILGRDWIHAINMCLLPCIKFSFSGSAMRSKWYMVTLHPSLQPPISTLLGCTMTSNAYRDLIYLISS